MTYYSDYVTTYSELKAKGTKFYTSTRCGGAITEEYWQYEKGFYVYTIHSNTNRYTGETGVSYLGNIENAREFGFYAGEFTGQEVCAAYDRMVAEREAKESPESKFKTARLATGLTYEQVAAAAHIDAHMVQGIEDGKINIDSIGFKKGLALAKALGVSPYDLASAL